MHCHSGVLVPKAFDFNQAEEVKDTLAPGGGASPTVAKTHRRKSMRAKKPTELEKEDGAQSEAGSNKGSKGNSPSLMPVQLKVYHLRTQQVQSLLQ